MAEERRTKEAKNQITTIAMAEERRTKETKNQITTSSADAAQPQPSEFKLVWITRWTCSACSVPTCYAHREDTAT